MADPHGEIGKRLTDEVLHRAWQAYYCPNPGSDGRYPQSAAAMRAVLVSALSETPQTVTLADKYCGGCGHGRHAGGSCSFRLYSDTDGCTCEWRNGEPHAGARMTINKTPEQRAAYALELAEEHRDKAEAEIGAQQDEITRLRKELELSRSWEQVHKDAEEAAEARVAKLEAAHLYVLTSWREEAACLDRDGHDVRAEQVNKCADQLRAALLSEDALSSWRPVESAPTDEWVLCWGGEYQAVFIGWCDRRIGWQNKRGHSIRTPTHWQPLPTPPTQEPV